MLSILIYCFVFCFCFVILCFTCFSRVCALVFCFLVAFLLGLGMLCLWFVWLLSVAYFWFSLIRWRLFCSFFIICGLGCFCLDCLMVCAIAVCFDWFGCVLISWLILICGVVCISALWLLWLAYFCILGLYVHVCCLGFYDGLMIVMVVILGLIDCICWASFVVYLVMSLVVWLCLWVHL